MDKMNLLEAYSYSHHSSKCVHLTSDQETGLKPELDGLRVKHKPPQALLCRGSGSAHSALVLLVPNLWLLVWAADDHRAAAAQ